MPQETKVFNSVEEVRDFVSAGGKFLVLDQDTLQQIEDAEAQGGFEGGFTGESDGAPFSGVGSGGSVSSEASESGPDDGLGFDVAWRAIGIEDAAEFMLDAKDIVETWFGHLTGPVLLVPREELQRWLGLESPTDGA